MLWSMANARAKGPILPMKIQNIIMLCPRVDISEVNPVDSPTVLTAEIISNNKSMNVISLPGRPNKFRSEKVRSSVAINMNAIAINIIVIARSI